MFSSFQAAGSLFPELTRLQQQLEEMFQPAGVAGIRSLAWGAFPAVNVGSTPDSVEVIAFAPGIDPEEIEITVDRGLLSLSGERRSDSSGQQGSQGQHLRPGTFHRQVPPGDQPSRGRRSGQGRGEVP